MQQLYFIKKGKLEWREVIAPKIENESEALVRPFAVAKCDADDIFLFNDISVKLKIGNALGLADPSFYKTFGKNFFQGPFPFGHECVAEIVETGEGVSMFRPGDVVSVPFQISCGSCINCSGGFTHACEKVPLLSTYGFGKHLQFGGAMSDLVKVPYADAMLLKIPDQTDPIHLASLSDNIPDAWRTVGPWLEKDKNKKVLVLGGNVKSISLYSVLIAKALGSPCVHYASRDERHLELALNAGADKVFRSLNDISEKYDITVDGSNNSKGLYKAINALAKGGVCTSVGIFAKKTTMPMIDMYVNGVHFVTGLSNARPDAEKALRLIQEGKLKPELITTQTARWEDAEQAFLSKTAKVIVTRNRLGSVAS